MTRPSEERGIAVRIADAATVSEREALLRWMIRLLQIRDSDLSHLQQAKQAILVTKQSEVTWPIVKLLAVELKRVGWDNRSAKSRAGLLTAGAAVALFGGQGAGIAALGTAIGVPLWIVLGAGAYFAAGLIQELISRIPKDRRAEFTAGNTKVIDRNSTDRKDEGDV